jgi:hypothetical protein
MRSTFVSEISPAPDDDQVLAFAQTEGRIIVTLDVRRFGNLIATSLYDSRSGRGAHAVGWHPRDERSNRAFF